MSTAVPGAAAFTRDGLPKSNTVPAGTYKVRVNGLKYSTLDEIKAKSPNTKLKDDQINADLVIVDEGEMFGRHIFDNLPCSGDFSFRLRRFLEAIDPNADAIPNGVDFRDQTVLDRLKDWEVMVSVIVTPETAEQPERNNVRQYIAVEL